MHAKNAGRQGRPFRRNRAAVLRASTVCWLCGHSGADSVDHVIARAICIATGRYDLLNAISNLRPAHMQPCPTCGIRCNRKRGMGMAKRKTVTVTASRQW